MTQPVFFVESKSVEGPGAEEDDAVGVVAVEFGELFRQQFDWVVLKLEWNGGYLVFGALPSSGNGYGSRRRRSGSSAEPLFSIIL